MMNEKYLTKIVAASLLGDGWVGIPNDGSINAKYRQNKTAYHLDYVDWLVEKLETLTKVSKIPYQPKVKNAKPAIEIQTRVHPFYTKFRNRMYPNGYKVVDPHYLTLIDWEFLAVWFQEDGTISIHTIKGTDYIEVRLCTDCFSYGDNHTLRIALKEKLDLNWTVANYRHNGKHKYRLLLRASDVSKFMSGVSTFILPSFSYKIHHTVGSRILRDEEIVRTVQECTELDRNDLTSLL